MKASRYVVAVSGGVDSVVLLDMLRQVPDVQLVVAHFDHGIRDDSAADRTFVAELAAHYGLPFESERRELGARASEATARRHRYRFLRQVAAKHQAKIVTAHHADDIVESIAINHVRGTGWRGLAVHDSDIVRPLSFMTKQEILRYADRHGLQWREDSTNLSDAYLRNRLRRRMQTLAPEAKRELLALHAQQKALKRQIDEEVAHLAQQITDLSGDGHTYHSRYFFTHSHPTPALAVLRHLTQGSLTRPQLERALLAIKTAQHKTTYQAGKGVQFRFTPRHFMIELIK